MRGLFRIVVIVVACTVSIGLRAQVTKVVYEAHRDMRDTVSHKGELYLEVDNLSFFRNNEYAGHIVKGYSLPGFWVQPKLGYYILDNVTLELGAHLMRYWGANSYPCYAYTDIVRWMGCEYQRGFHALPWFRGHVSLDCGVDLVLGNIYGGVNHGLIEPLYNKELTMTADPEAGVQVLYEHKYFEGDVWLNWESFIFQGDTHQEAFSLGGVMRANITPRDAEHHVYAFGQAVAQHRGGEIDTIHTASAQTFLNEAGGLGWQWNVDYGYLKRVELEAYGAGFHQVYGDIWPFKSGWGAGARAAADLGGFRVSAGYWYNDDFISIYGLPHFGAASATGSGEFFDTPQLLTVGAEYSYSFSELVHVGVDFDLYQRFDKGDPSTSFTCGVYLRLTPRFVLLKN